MIEQANTNKVADAIKHSWVYHLPEWVWPYAQLARWERPIGWQLLMWPCWWSLALAWNKTTLEMGQAGSTMNMLVTPPFVLFFMGLFWFGAFLMRGAGCTYNDLVDQDIDDKVARTRSRPLPSGRVTTRGTLVFLVIQLLLGLVVLMQFNWTVIGLGVLSLITVLVYPFMKRVTWWPQFFLGLAFSWGALVGWWSLIGLADVPHSLELWLPPVLLYLGSICWVIGYDTIYAHQDIEDDALVGVKSTARLFGENTFRALLMLYGAAVILIAGAFFQVGVGWLAWAGLGLGVAQLIWQLTALNIHDPEHCLKLFKSNSLFGLILFVGLVLSVFAEVV